MKALKRLSDESAKGCPPCSAEGCPPCSAATLRDCPTATLRAVARCAVATVRAPLDLYRWIRMLCSVFGVRFMVTLFVVQHVLKGFAAGGGSDGLIFVGFKFKLKELQVDASRLNTLFAVAASPWAMKPILGFTSDLFPLCGFHKISWMLLTTIFSILACLAFGLFGGLESFSAELATFLIFVICVQIALCDLLSEAKYARMLRLHAKEGPALMSFVWGGMYAAQLLSTGLTGALLEFVSAHYCIVAATPAAAVLIFPLVQNWLGDARWKRGGSDEDEDGDALDAGIGERGGEDNGEEDNDGEDADAVGAAAVLGFNPPDIVGEREPEGEDGRDGLLLEASLVDIDLDDDGAVQSSSSLVDLGDYRDGQQHSFTSSSIRVPPSKGRALIERCIAIDLTKARAQKKLFLLALIMGMLSIVFTALQFAGGSSVVAAALSTCPDGTGPDVGFICHCTDELVGMSLALLAGVIVIVAFAFLTMPMIAKAQAFFFVQHMFTISVEAATLYFYTDDEKQYPAGPHFSNAFYVTAIGFVSAVASLIGIAGYNKWMFAWKYRTLLTVTNLIFMAVNVVSALVYFRWNLAIGIPDWAFVLGSDAAQQMVLLWTWMPSIVILSQLCPKGVEATMYALLAGSANFANQLARSEGSFVLCALGVEPSGAPNESKMFDNLPYAVLLASVLPIIPLLLLPFLIPDAKQTDNLLLENDAAQAPAVTLDFQRMENEETEDDML